MAQMRAVLVKNGAGGVENLYIGETPKPTLSPGQVLVKVSKLHCNNRIPYMPEVISLDPLICSLGALNL